MSAADIPTPADVHSQPPETEPSKQVNPIATMTPNKAMNPIDQKGAGEEMEGAHSHPLDGLKEVVGKSLAEPIKVDEARVKEMVADMKAKKGQKGGGDDGLKRCACGDSAEPDAKMPKMDTRDDDFDMDFDLR